MNLISSVQSNNQKAKVKPVINYSEVEPDNRKKDSLINKIEPPAAMREISVDVAQSFTNDVVGGVMDGFMRQLLGQPTVTPEVTNQANVGADSEALLWKKRFRMAERRRQEEKNFYVRKEQESKQRLVSVRQELQVQVSSMSRDMAMWAKEVEIATFEAPVDAGIYHETFFETLISFVKNIRKRVTRSRHWLRTLNAKSAKKKGLWGMAKKGNTYDQEVLYSGERAVSMGG